MFGIIIYIFDFKKKNLKKLVFYRFSVGYGSKLNGFAMEKCTSESENIY